MTDAKFGSFEDLLAITTAAMRPIAMQLRNLILAIDPNAVEVVRLGDRAATYGVGPKKMSEGYVYVLPYAAWVNLGFCRGTDLDDPAGRLEGTGSRMRHFKIRTADAADDPELSSLIKAALSERIAAVGPRQSDPQ